MNVAVSPLDDVIERIQRTYRGWTRGTPVERMRSDWDALFPLPSAEVLVTPVDADGVRCTWIVAAGTRDDRTVFYVHGGGFRVGSVRSHGELMAAISAATGCRVLGVDYRLAPECSLVEAMDDVATAYAWLCRRQGGAGDIVVAGDSAGANLALTLAIEIAIAHRRAEGRVERSVSSPAALVLLSPWTDMTASGESYATRSASDPIHQRPMMLALARGCLAASLDPTDPRASPIFADLTGLPPMLIQVGDRETLLSDAVVLAEKARAAGGEVELDVWAGMIHVFQQYPGELREAREAIAAIGTFVRSRLDRSTSAAS